MSANKIHKSVQFNPMLLIAQHSTNTLQTNTCPAIFKSFSKTTFTHTCLYTTLPHSIQLIYKMLHNSIQLYNAPQHSTFPQRYNTIPNTIRSLHTTMHTIHNFHETPPHNSTNLYTTQLHNIYTTLIHHKSRHHSTTLDTTLQQVPTLVHESTKLKSLQYLTTLFIRKYTTFKNTCKNFKD